MEFLSRDSAPIALKVFFGSSGRLERVEVRRGPVKIEFGGSKM